MDVDLAAEPDPLVARRIEAARVVAPAGQAEAGRHEMTGAAPDMAFDASKELALPPVAPAPELLELWFRLAQRTWTSVALVPADGGTTAAAPFARSLAEVGRRLHGAPVTAIAPDELDFATAAALAECVRAAARSPEGARVVVAVPPLVIEPLGTAAVQAADVVVLCIELGRTRLAGARRTLDLVGRERVVGSLLV
ncbi:hypothetical protein AMOR_36330 [Anaeromyxobacter oryzae]|uniref:Uncharacterized protein n=1 Tax=Anaeromyxobacter oryzae TaxID=2918170 RepID=A0ABN6MUH6_9BACT|nr:hypothetical protein AMOR_36330 [Anaeromyxobacter oryzae]